MIKLNLIFFLIIISLKVSFIDAQIVYRPLPAEWENLVSGGNFMDRFLPMPKRTLEKDIWGAYATRPRYVDNGIEDDSISYWGGNIIKGVDNKYHMFLCGWPEDNPEGHMGYKTYSIQYHAVSENSIGPFKVKEVLGEGHNTEILQLNDGKYMVYHVTGGNPEKHCNYLLSESLEGPWEKHVFQLDKRDRETRLGGGTWFHNMTFTKREDGSVLMMSRMGSIWVSKTGTSPYHLITTKSVYPMASGKYEDPVIWKDHVQYNAIVNDWIGRTAFYLRSKDGVNWIIEDGRAYIPGVSYHENGHIENWYKYERMRVFQDDYGRAIQANFAVIDANKHDDLSNDRHSSKNIGIPLNPGMLLTMETTLPFDKNTKKIEVRIKAEANFKPIIEVDIESLRFGVHSEVNYGRGAKALKGIPDGEDLIVVFEANNHYIDEGVFAPKILGKTKKGDMLFGYCRLPWVSYIEPILSARKPVFKKGKLTIVVENHGQVSSKPTYLTLNSFDVNGKSQEWINIPVPVIKPYGKTELKLTLMEKLIKGKTYPVAIKILSRDSKPVLFRTKLNF
ncbi:glycoside hydrolase family protein [Seonamhaeicola maritimus]|uniref:Family 43 glycosylhydrolase n=1 Tax=Seonamhaeicola maritimus TaxID=2591822 RepID=A0A5C7GL45_9FLAO|nr:glycoside hydrolase family protein [Seonamhaeicola maritimus]TXG39098.1 hypothetical protein FUA22_04250 [Seonamhaeicola maritimus]